MVPLSSIQASRGRQFIVQPSYDASEPYQQPAFHHNFKDVVVVGMP